MKREQLTNVTTESIDQRKALTIEVRVAPSAWASYLINGDASGLSDGEQAQIDAWIDAEGLGSPVSCEDHGFTNSHDAYQFCPLAADCQNYQFLL
jgi:hypothetical protein